jgi:hypothetical protein
MSGGRIAPTPALDRTMWLARFLIDALKDGAANGETKEIRAWCSVVLSDAVALARLDRPSSGTDSGASRSGTDTAEENA